LWQREALPADDGLRSIGVEGVWEYRGLGLGARE
jgi:hypothetical protein